MKLNKSVLRVMKENKGQYLGMFYMVLLSSFLFVFFMLAAANLSTNKNAYFSDYVMGDIEFASRTEVANIAYIEKQFDIQLEGALTKDVANESKTIRLFTPNKKVNIPAVLDGRLPQPGEIALDPQFAKANSYKLGGIIGIEGKSYTISGTICLPNYAYVLKKPGDLVNDFNTFGVAVMNEADLITGELLYSVKYNTPQKDIYAQAKPLKSYLNQQGVQLLSWNYAKYDMKTNMPDVEVQMITVYSWILPPFLMLLSAALAAAVLGRMVKSQSGVIGTLYALGYRKGELMRHYLSYPLRIGIFGGVLGGVMGMVTIVPFLNLMHTFFPMPIKELIFNPIYILFGTALTTFILCAGVYFVLNKVLSASPVSLMRNDAKTGKPNFLERRLPLSSMRFETVFSIRENLRSIPRLALMLVGVLAATALLMFGLITKSSMDYLISSEGTKATLTYNYEYGLHVPQNTKPPMGGEPIAGRKFVPEFNTEQRFEIIGSVPDGSIVSLFDKSGKPIRLDDKKAVITKTMAAKYGLKPGDTIRFSDIISDRELSIIITDIADSGLGDYIFVSLERFDELLGWEKGAYNAIMSLSPIDIDPALVYKLTTPESLTDSLADFMLLMNTFLYGIAVVAAVIAMIIIYILAAVSIDEQKGGIALMKVFGYKKSEVGALMTNSSRLLVLASFAIGVPLSYYSISTALTFIFGLLNLTIEVRLDWYFVLLGLVLIVGAFELSKKLCLRKIAGIPMSEVLKAQKE